MATAYTDPNTVHNPSTGAVAPAAWGDVIRDDLEALIEPPACSVYHSTTQSVAASTTVYLSANSENFDNDGLHSTVTNTSRITIQKTGRYELISTVQFAPEAAGSGVRNVKFRVNGTTTYESIQVVHTSTGSSAVLPGTRKLDLTAGDYVECGAFQSSPNSVNVTLLEFACKFDTR